MFISRTALPESGNGPRSQSQGPHLGHTGAGDEDSKYFDPFIMGLIFLNVAAVVLETVDWIYLRYASLFDVFNIFSVAVFTVEYTLRVWSCTATRSSKIRSGAGSVS
jgi:hypothetical protein